MSESQKDIENEEALETVEDQSQAENTDQAPVEVEDAFVKLQQDLNAAQDRYLRLGADFDNFKKREQREREISIKFANERMLTDLLPVVDNLENAVNAANNGTSDDALLKNVVTGVKMVLKQFQDTLERFGAQQFSAVGQKFDPTLHEAMQEREAEDVQPGIVVEEYQKGYLLNGRLVRPARVVIAKAPADKVIQ